MSLLVGLPMSAASTLCRRSTATLLTGLRASSASPLLPNLVSSPSPRQFTTFLRPSPLLSYQQSNDANRIPRSFPRRNVQDSIAVAVSAKPSSSKSSSADDARRGGFELAVIALALVGAATVAGMVGDKGRSGLSSNSIRCDSAPFSSSSRPLSSDPSIDEIPKSIVSVPSLTFGTLCGLCAGVFIKKGAKLIAFFLGAGYVLLQYLSSESLISVDWSAMSDRYDRMVSRYAAESDKEGSDAVRRISGNNSQIVRIWNRFVHFLTADFQQRATFLGGLALGLRLG